MGWQQVTSVHSPSSAICSVSRPEWQSDRACCRSPLAADAIADLTAKISGENHGRFFRRVRTMNDDPEQEFLNSLSVHKLPGKVERQWDARARHDKRMLVAGLVAGLVCIILALVGVLWLMS